MVMGGVRTGKDPRVRPACPLVAFGFGGRVLTMFPRPKRKLGSLMAPTGSARHADEEDWSGD